MGADIQNGFRKKKNDPAIFFQQRTAFLIKKVKGIFFASIVFFIFFSTPGGIGNDEVKGKGREKFFFFQEIATVHLRRKITMGIFA